MKPEPFTDYAGKRVLVLSGSGFIGSKLTQALASHGANVFAGSRLSQVNRAGSDDSRPISYLQCDVTVLGELSAAFDQAQPEIVFNLTMAPRGNGGIADYNTQLATTFGGTINIAKLINEQAPQ